MTQVLDKNRKNNKSKITDFLIRSEMITVYVVLALVVFVSIKDPSFLGGDNLIAILKGFSFYAIMAVPLTFLMVSLAFDMSIGMMVALSGTVSALLMRDHGMTFGWAVLVAILIGALLGSCSGFLHAVMKINAFIATLSMMYIEKGLFWVLTKQVALAVPEQTANIPDAVAGIPISIWILIVLAIIGHIILKYTAFGKSIYIVGNNPEMAREVGVSETKVKMILFVALGVVAGICASAIIATYKSIPNTTGTKYEFYVNAGTILGGCSVYGGKGSIVGSLIGTAVMTIVQFSMRSLQVNVNWQYIFLGLILLSAVVLDTVKEKRRI